MVVLIVSKPKRGCSPGTTRICLDGFPRSGNSTMVRKFWMLKTGYGRKEVAHHSHQAATIIDCVEAGLPCVGVIRHPLDCLVSLMEFQGTDTPPVKRYIKFYGALRKLRQEIMMVRFETMLNDYNVIIAQLNERHDLTLPRLPMSDEKANVLANVSAVKSGLVIHGGAWESKTGAPRDGRSRDQLREKVLAAHGYEQCERLYENILKFAI